MKWIDIFPWKKYVKVYGTIEWLVDYYYEGPPPIVIEYLNRKKEFYEKFVKLLDIKKVKDARVVFFAKKNAIDLKFIEISTSFGIYMTINEDLLIKAINGEDLFEINSVIIKNFRNREVLKNCKNEILELLNNECLTLNEIIERLSFKYEKNTIKNQVRNLLLHGKILKLCRLNTGEVIYGLPGKIYKIRDNLSKESKKKYIRKLILNLIKSKPMNYLEIMEILGLSKNLITSTLRELRKKGMIKKEGDKWIFQISGEG
ncbi:MAG: winged helix-turn-helix domain-containing protein [Candidatus Methanomethylicaceae archaeon]